MPSESVPLRWSGYEHEHIERGSDWFWALGIIAIATATTSVLFGNILFAILIVTAAGTLALIARTPPREVMFEISDAGIKVGDTLHSYDEILFFWVEKSPEHPLLLVDTTKFMAPNLVIPLTGADPELVRAYLSERVEEKPMTEPFSHKVLELFGL